MAAQSAAAVNVSKSLSVWVCVVTSNSYIVDEVIEVEPAVHAIGVESKSTLNMHVPDT